MITLKKLLENKRPPKLGQLLYEVEKNYAVAQYTEESCLELPEFFKPIY